MPYLEVRDSLVNCTEHSKVDEFFALTPDSVTADLSSYLRGSFGPSISLWLDLGTARAAVECCYRCCTQ